MEHTKIVKHQNAMYQVKTIYKSGWREIGGKRKFYRSKWEANYSRYLEYLKNIGQIKDWLHEPETFWFRGIKRGCVSYLPDFKIFNNDQSFEFHEVKGYMDSKSATKIKRMAKYYPEIKLIVVKKREYKEISLKLGRLIPGWEK